MALKRYKPTSNGRRNMTAVKYKDILSTSKPHKALLSGGKNTSGRNSAGRLTSRFRGGGHKRKFRAVDFVYDKKDIPARVETIEYDPYRSAFISLICYRDGERRYIIAPQKIQEGDEIIVSLEAPIKPGNRLPLTHIPLGTFVYNVEANPGSGAKFARSAGNAAELVAIDAGKAQLKMPSGEIRRVVDQCWASIGEVSNEHHGLVNIGKAGRSRHLGRRPRVRGSAMNAVDHPHGGGEGRAGRGHRRQRTFAGRPAGKGQKTRAPKKYSNQNIIRRRRVKMTKNNR
ncbi:MAG: 50S ribosomal protein L2 [Patescibacteria group bacterium]